MSFTVLLTMILLSTFTVSCGQNKATSTNPAIDKQTEEQSADMLDSGYSSVLIGAESMAGQYVHQIKMELQQRPLIISANYSGNKNCSFDLEVSDIQANEIQKLAAKLKICTFQDETGVVIDADAQYIVLKDNLGNENYANRDLLGMDDEKYLCEGKKDFYDYIQKIIAKEAQSEACPTNALSSMF